MPTAFARFDGTNDATGDNILIANNSAYEATTLSVESWFRLEPGASLGSYNRIVEMATSGNGNVLGLYVNGSGQLGGSPGNTHFTASGADLRDGDWHHVAMTYEPGGSNAHLYLDGVLYATTTYGTVTPTSEPLMIGDFDDDGSHPQNFPGDIADVRIWDDIRTAQEISDNRSTDLTGNEAGLVGHWKLDEGQGTTANDNSATANNGTLQNGAAFVNEAPLEVSVTGQSLEFDGATAYVDAGDVDTVDGLAHMTVAAWINPDEVDAGGNGIVSKWSNGEQGFIVRLKEPGYLEIHLADSDATAAGGSSFWFGPAVDFDTWTHVAVSVDAANGPAGLEAYANGAELSQVGSSNPGYFNASPLISTDAPLRIGAWETATDTIDGHFDGNIADVQIFGSVLSRGSDHNCHARRYPE